MPPETIIIPSSQPPVPMGADYTFGQMRSDVAGAFGMDGDFNKEALAGRYIQGCVDDMNMRQTWDFNIVSSPEIPTVAGQKDYSLVTYAPDFWKTYNVRKTSDIDYMISTLRQKVFDTMVISQKNITGFPYLMTIKNGFRDGLVSLFPAPDTVYTFKLNYYKLIQRPGNDTSPLDLPPPYQRVPYWGACRMMALYNNQIALAVQYEKLYEQGLKTASHSDEDIGDEDLRFVNIEEIMSRGVNWSQPGIRPRAYDFF